MRRHSISTIYKNKGSRSNLENDRGIFTSTVPDMILQKLIHNDIYDDIDSNLSDSNVGSRKRKNIRNNSFIINGIINDAASSKSKPVDLAILDYKQCFDSMSVDVTTNDLYEVGVTNDKLNLMFESDASSKIAIKTPVGLTERKEMKKIVAQGKVVSSLKYTVTVDSISQTHTENLSEHLYLYRGIVPIPPLGMVDDQVGVSHCGIDSAISTAHLNAQTNIKKLQFGASKCHKMHIGKSSILCPRNTIDTWTMEKDHENAKTILEFSDKEGEPHEMELLQNDLYLGDVLQDDGKNVKNIDERYRRGSGAVKQVCQMLDELCLGSYHFEAGIILRNSLVLSSLISNSESWYNLTSRDISRLEEIDEQMLRKMLFAHSKTPIELLYLETGSIPIRFILMSRRLNFLHYILNEDENSLIYQFLMAQSKNPGKYDWVKLSMRI